MLPFLCALYSEVSPFLSFTFPMHCYLESCRGKRFAFKKSHPHFEAALGLRLQGKSLNLIVARSWNEDLAVGILLVGEENLFTA